jgi:16S rRNA (cytidine1402-2'-O)-methyltransferase
LKKLLTQLAEHAGMDRQAVVARELSKKFEEFRRGTLEELLAWVNDVTKVRGEIVVLIASPKASQRLNEAPKSDEAW